MKKLKLIQVLVLTISIHLSLSEDCKTPAECYVRAIALLKNARDEYRTSSDKMIVKNDEDKKEYNSLLENAKKNMKDEVEVLKNELKSANDEIKRLNANLESLNSLVASITQYGGSYQIDDCGKNHVLNPLTGGLVCGYGFQARQVGRILTPESRCGANQYVCLK